MLGFTPAAATRPGSLRGGPNSTLAVAARPGAQSLIHTCDSHLSGTLRHPSRRAPHLRQPLVQELVLVALARHRDLPDALVVRRRGRQLDEEGLVARHRVAARAIGGARGL
eukprot:10055-Chlamydomonas_euryale.AAC.1